MQFQDDSLNSKKVKTTADIFQKIPKSHKILNRWSIFMKIVPNNFYSEYLKPF